MRPDVGEIDGLQILTGKANGCGGRSPTATTLQISTFIDENPRGFGFLQRDRNFDALSGRRSALGGRPSLWIEPIGDWSSAACNWSKSLPNPSNDNIIAYWRPKTVAERRQRNLLRLSAVLVLVAAGAPAARDGRCVARRAGLGARSTAAFWSNSPARFSAGQQLRNDFKPNLSVSPGIDRLRSDVRFAPTKRSYRVLFEIDPGGETLFRTAPRR